MTQKTILIWDAGDQEIKFLIVAGERRHLHDHYLNVALPACPAHVAKGWNKACPECHTIWESYNSKDRELDSLVMDEGSIRRHGWLTDFPTTEVLEGAFVIVCGMVP